MNNSTDSHTLMIVHDVDNTLVGARFSQWPLHITILFYFTYVGIDESKVIARVSELATKIGPIPVTTGTVAMYGSKKDIPVTKLNDPTGTLGQLQSVLFAELSDLGCQFGDTTYVLGNYSPHISHIGSRTGPVSEYMINHISVVKKVPGRSKWTKVILAKVML
jgi:2'-5' RNA ligase